MTENQKYGTLIAKLMRDNLSHDEEKELDDWVTSDKQNMQLFLKLINGFNARWARRWFREAGVSTRDIKWKNTEGWYKPEQKGLRNFYILAALVFVVMLGVFLLLKYS